MSLPKTSAAPSVGAQCPGHAIASESGFNQGDGDSDEIVFCL
jgi:hypothetical protein